MKKPMLAEDFEEDQLVFPLGLQGKVDGVRAWNPQGELRARSMKPIRNKYIQAFYSKPEFKYLDGELAAEHEGHPDLCRISTSATSSFDGEPFTLWHVFDYVEPRIAQAPYKDRYEYLEKYVKAEQLCGRLGTVRLVPMHIVNNMEELLYWEDYYLNLGYEGVILRSLHRPHKQGRSTVKEGGLLRIKRFIEINGRVLSITEGQTNNNEATINEVGRTKRSTHQENMTPNGMLGSMEVELLEDAKDPQTKRILVPKGDIATVSPGNMPHGMRVHLMSHPEEIVQKFIKFKMFPKGVKDKPRFPTWTCMLDETNM